MWRSCADELSRKTHRHIRSLDDAEKSFNRLRASAGFDLAAGPDVPTGAGDLRKSGKMRYSDKLRYSSEVRACRETMRSTALAHRASSECRASAQAVRDTCLAVQRDWLSTYYRGLMAAPPAWCSRSEMLQTLLDALHSLQTGDSASDRHLTAAAIHAIVRESVSLMDHVCSLPSHTSTVRDTGSRRGGVCERATPSVLACSPENSSPLTVLARDRRRWRCRSWRRRPSAC